MAYATDPSFDIADNFITAYNDKENELHKTALEVYKSIVESYYKDVEIPELETESLLLNVQQWAGIDINLFNSIELKRDDYSEKNLISFENKTDEKPAGEEESKNA